MIVRYRSLGDSGDIYSIPCNLPATNLQEVRCLNNEAWKRGKWGRKKDLIVPGSGHEEVGFGTETETGDGISGRLIHLQNSPSNHQNYHTAQHKNLLLVNGKGLWGTSKDLFGFGLVLLRKLDICKSSCWIFSQKIMQIERERGRKRDYVRSLDFGGS